MIGDQKLQGAPALPRQPRRMSVLAVVLILLELFAARAVLVDVTTEAFPDGVPPGVEQGTVAWSDFDNDGRLDFLLSGSFHTVLYAQLEPSKFTNVTNATYFPHGTPPGLSDGTAVAWGDVDGNGLQDFFLLGWAQSEQPTTTVFLQTSPGSFRNDLDSSLFPEGIPPPLFRGDVACIDFDSDGYDDVFITGFDGRVVHSLLYAGTEEIGSGVFFRDITTTATFPGGLPPGLMDSAVAWSDFDGDGMLDFALSGGDGYATHTIVYKQVDIGVFHDVSATLFKDGLPGLYYAALSWSTIGLNSEHPDLAILGLGCCPAEDIFKVFTSDVDAGYTESTESSFAGDPPLGRRGSVEWVDFNVDGLPDLWISGPSSVGLFQQVGNRQLIDVAGDEYFFPYRPPLPLLECATAWGDFDSDGFPDFIYTGRQRGKGLRFFLFQNRRCPIGSVFAKPGTCHACASFEIVDALAEKCRPCADGLVPDISRSWCTCPGNAVLADSGGCEPCPGRLVPDDFHHECVPCPNGTTPDSTYTACTDHQDSLSESARGTSWLTWTLLGLALLGLGLAAGVSGVAVLLTRRCKLRGGAAVNHVYHELPANVVLLSGPELTSEEGVGGDPESSVSVG